VKTFRQRRFGKRAWLDVEILFFGEGKQLDLAAMSSLRWGVPQNDIAVQGNHKLETQGGRAANPYELPLGWFPIAPVGRETLGENS
jgi:hypothetical protein